jgi:hypothetical protein
MRQQCLRVLWFSALLSLAPVVLGQSLPPEVSTPSTSIAPVAVVSFELYHNRVYLPVSVNGSRPYTMILDTGAAETFASENVAEELKLPRKGKATVNGNGEGVARFALTKDVNFGVGAGSLLEKTVVIYDYTDFEKHEGRKVDGTLGVNFFHRYVVEIDYKNKKLMVYEPGSFHYEGPGTKVPLQILNGGTLALFDAEITPGSGGEAIKARLAVDSGTYSALRLFRPFVERYALVGEGRNQVSSFGFGAGGEFRQVTGRVDSLKIGDVKLANPVADFSTDTKGVTATAAYEGTIGGDILRRFTVILDYSRSEMILEPNSDFSKPFEMNTSGLTLVTDPGFAKVLVAHVVKNSSAALAGIHEGDLIGAVDGKSVGMYSFDQLRSMVEAPGDHEVEVTRGDIIGIKLQIHNTPKQ